MSGVIVREAQPDDLSALLEIYNHEVLYGVATFDTEERPLAYMEGWLAAHSDPYFALVAEIEGVIAGYASVSQYNWRAAYGFTVEDSVYIHPASRRQGVGLALLEAVVAGARQHGFHTVLGRITSDNIASLELHARLGFVRCGLDRELGNKFGRWLDVVTMQLILD